MNSKITSVIFKWIISILGVSVIFISFFLFGYIFWKGRNIVDLNFVFSYPSGVPIGTSGGIFPALIGTLYLGFLSVIIGGIPALFISLYISFYSKNRFFDIFLHKAITVMSGVPSILFGLIGYTVLIKSFGMRRSLFISSVCIGTMILPFITIRCIKIFREKGYEYMKVSKSLGLSIEYSLTRIILPNLFTDILENLAIAMAYGMGAVAPILYTGAVMNSDIPKSIFDPFMSLPYHLYMLVNNGFSIEYAYGTAFVLMSLLLIIQISIRLLKYIISIYKNRL